MQNKIKNIIKAKRKGETNIGCLANLFYLGIYLLLGAYSAQYLIWIFLQKDIPFIADLIIGFIGGELAIPLALIIWIINLF